MAYLASPSKTAELIGKYRFVFRKRYGQNFLVDASMVEKIVDAAELTKEDTVLEIGPGIGTMTQFLAERAGSVIAVEIDEKLLPILEETLSGYENVTVINEDILRLDIRELVAERNGGRPIKVVANLPYYITTPILMALLEGEAPIESITIMIQREVAERMRAEAGTKDYGALTLSVQYHSVPEKVCTVPPSCFMPRPTVESTVLTLRPYEKPPVAVEDPAKMFAVIRAAFGQRRKTLPNALSNAADLHLTRAQVEEALEQMSLDKMIRGERLTLEQFARLSDLLNTRG